MWVPRLRRVIVSRDVKFLNKIAFEPEYQEFLDEPIKDIEETEMQGGRNIEEKRTGVNNEEHGRDSRKRRVTE